MTVSRLSQPPPVAPAQPLGAVRGVVLPCLLLMGSMFNLTLVVAGLKELILEELGGTVTDATLFFSVETLAYILFAPLWGLASDRLRLRKPFVFVGFLLSALLYASFLRVQSVELLLGLRFVQGAFSVMGWSTVMAMILDDPERGKSGRTMGMMGAALIFGVALGAPVGGYLTRWFGARAPLAAGAVLFGLLALGSLFLRGGRTSSHHVRISEISRALRARPRLALPLVFHFVDRLAVGLFVVVFPLYIDSLGADDPAIRGRYLSLFLVPFALLQMVTGRLAERVGPYRPLILGSLAYGLLLMAVGISDLYLLWPVMIGLGVFAAVMFPPAILLTAQLADPRTRASAIGGFNLAGSLGFAVGPLLGGWAYERWGFGVAFAGCGLLEVVLAFAAAALLSRWRRRA